MYLRLFASILFCICTCLLQAQPNDKKWKLIFEDNFEGSTLDTTKWSFGFGWGINSSAFEENNRPQNLTFKDNMAILKAEEENGTYYSAAINTRNKMVMQYGYWEIRSRISKNVSGVDFGFWQKKNHDKWPPELDIYEFMGVDKRQSTNIHWSDNGHKESQDYYDGGDFTKDFHVFGLETQKEYIRFYTDGKMVREITREQSPIFFGNWNEDAAYTIINIHLSNRYEVFGKVDSSNLPVYMYVDYFRMYEAL